jgi:hypothetical protein
MNHLLKTILTTKRADKSVGDYLFRAWLLQQLAEQKPFTLGDGNIVVKLGASRVAFSCHIDTCHSTKESDGSPQVIVEDMGLILLADRSGCLGADDGLGIYLMLRLIAHGTPGTYIFHTGEECGSEGSRSIVDGHPEFCAGFDLIVAFDRAVKPGQAPEVIIQQSSTECASVECGQALCDALGMGFVVSRKGVFTDTLNYADSVRECLNVGCFYDLQHSPQEYVDLEQFELFEQAVLAIDWDALPVKRSPAPKKSKYRRYSALISFGADDSDAPAVDDKLYDALAAAELGTFGPIREALNEYLGEDYKSYINSLVFSETAIDLAFEALLDGEDYEYVLSLLWGESLYV